jgi:hypothetical protein
LTGWCCGKGTSSTNNKELSHKNHGRLGNGLPISFIDRNRRNGRIIMAYTTVQELSAVGVILSSLDRAWLIHERTGPLAIGIIQITARLYPMEF